MMRFQQQDLLPAEMDEQRVVDYLKQHSDFLVNHPRLIDILEIPHGLPGAVSLVEHQISSLRGQNKDLRGRLNELIKQAKRHHELNERLHKISLDLLGCHDLPSLLQALNRALIGDLRVDWVAVRVFAPPLRSCSDCAELLDADAGREMSALFKSERPRCGRLSLQQMTSLWPNQVERIQSAALVPLGGESVFAVIGMASKDAERFHVSARTDFLNHLGDLVGANLAPYLQLRDSLCTPY